MTEIIQTEKDINQTNNGQDLENFTNNSIKYWDAVNTLTKKDVGQIITSKVTMVDNSIFIYREINPLNQKVDISVDFSPPLATTVNGYNTYVGIKLAQLGIPSRIIGTDQTHHHSLRHASHASHHILNQADLISDNKEKGKSIIIGYSMGAMKAMGMLATAQLYNREIPFALGLDPCLAQKIHYDQINPVELALYTIRETQELGKILINDLFTKSLVGSIKRNRYYLDSINLSPKFVFNVIDKWITLSSGEAGTLAQEVPKDASMILHFFSNSKFNDQLLFREILAKHPNVAIVTEDAYHISGSSNYIVDKVAAKLALAQRLIAENTKPADLINALRYNLI